MRWLLALALLGSVAQADPVAPVARFGMTFGVDRNAPEAHEVGPLIGFGIALGRFIGEANYTYLSFMDPNTSIHRVGLAVRASFFQRDCIHCSDPSAAFGEIGAAVRRGNWGVAIGVD